MKKVGKGILGFLLVLLVCSPLILIVWGRSMLHDSDVANREELIPSSPPKRVLAIFPHPDDEVTVAGTVMGLKAAGHQVTLVCFTRGEKGNEGSWTVIARRGRRPGRHFCVPRGPSGVQFAYRCPSSNGDAGHFNLLDGCLNGYQKRRVS